MNHVRLLLLAILLAVSVPEGYAQWARGAGRGYAQVAVGRATANAGFDAAGRLRPLGAADVPETYEDEALYLYLEYGLEDHVTLIASTYAKAMRVEQPDARFATSGLSDLTLQLRYTAQLGAVVLSPQVGLKVPSGYVAEASPPLGSGRFDFIVAGTAGVSFYPFPAYLGTGLGLRLRGGVPQDEVYGHLEAGLHVLRPLLVRGRVDFAESTTNSGMALDVLGQVREQGYLTAGPGLTVFATPRWHVNVDARWTPAGRTTARIFNVIAGVAYQW